MTFPTIKLPERALRLAQNLISMPKAVYFSLPILIGLTVFMAVSEVPGILRDWTISQNPVKLANGDIRDGKCSTRKGFFTTCEAHLNYVYDGRAYDKDVEIMFVDIHVGDYDTDWSSPATIRTGDPQPRAGYAVEPDHNACRVRRPSWGRLHRHDLPDPACLACSRTIAPGCSARAGPCGNHSLPAARQAADGDLYRQDRRQKNRTRGPYEPRARTGTLVVGARTARPWRSPSSMEIRLSQHFWTADWSGSTCRRRNAPVFSRP